MSTQNKNNKDTLKPGRIITEPWNGRFNTIAAQNSLLNTSQPIFNTNLNQVRIFFKLCIQTYNGQIDLGCAPVEDRCSVLL